MWISTIYPSYSHGEIGSDIDDELPDAHLFRVEGVADQFVDITTYLMIGSTPTDLTIVQNKQLVTKSISYQLIARQLYKLGAYSILCRCAMDHEHDVVLYEAYEGVVGGHNVGMVIAWIFFHIGLWWLSLFQDSNRYCQQCDICQRIGRSSQSNEMPLFPACYTRTFWQVSNWFCWTNQPSCAMHRGMLHHLCNKVLDSMSVSSANQGLYHWNHYAVHIWAYHYQVWMS